MKTYYWMDVPSQSRTVIDEKDWPGTELIDEVQAGSWIEAKRELGLPLTALQEMILGGEA